MKLLVVVLFVLTSCSAFAEQSRSPVDLKLKFAKISGNDLSSVSKFNKATKDSRGYLWIAAVGRLIRYDGYEFTSYGNGSSDENVELIDGALYSVVLDHNSELWIGSEYSLINLDETSTSLYLRDDPIAAKYIDNPKLISENKALPPYSIRSIYPSDDGTIWYGSGTHLVHFNPSVRSYKEYSPWSKIGNKNLTKLQLSFVEISGIVKTDENTFWLSTIKRGIIKYDIPSNEAEIIDSWGESNNAIQSVNAIIERDENNILLGTDEGLLNLNTATNQITAFPTANKIVGKITSLAKNNVGEIWAGGEHVYKIGEDSTVLQYDRKNDFRINNLNSLVGTIYVDEQDTVYVFYNNNGIYRASQFSSKVRLINNIPGVSNNVRYLTTDPTGNLWTAHDKGLVKGRLVNGQFDYQIYRHKDGKDYEGISAIHAGLNENVWVAEKRSISRISPNGETSFLVDKAIFGDSFVNSLVEDYNGKVWFSGHRRGVFILDPSTGLVEKALSLTEQQLDSWQYINLLLSENRQALTYFKSSGGFGVFDIPSGEFVNVYKDKDRKKQYESNLNFKDTSAWEVRRDPKTQVTWITHAEPYISFYDEKNNIHKTIDTPILEPLIGVTVEDSRLWLSAESGALYRWDLKTNSLNAFSIADGLPDTGVSKHSGATSGTNVFFGSKKGIVVVTSDSLEKNIYDSKTVISGIEINNDNTRNLARLRSADSPALQLNYDENIIELTFFGDSTSSPESNKFRYRLVGLYESWQNSKPNERKTKFTNLDPGNYIFEVQSTNNDQTWGSDITKLHFTISAPPWATNFAYVAYALSFLLLVWYFDRLRGRVRKHNESKLKLLIESSTREISEMWQFNNNTMFDLTHELKGAMQFQLTEIENLPKELAARMNVDGLFLSNKKIARIVNQLLNLASLKTMPELNLVTFNVVDLISNTARMFLSQAKLFSVSIEVETLSKHLFVKGEQDSIERVFTNFISNAIKYNSIGGKVTIRVCNMNGKIVVIISDNGNGISKTSLPSNIKYSGDYCGSVSRKNDKYWVSHGVGLGFVAEAAKRNKLEISVESSSVSGCSFYLAFEKGAKNEAISLSETSINVVDTWIEGRDSLLVHDITNEMSIIANRETILVVDDNIMLLGSLAKQLNNYFNVIVSNNAKDALVRADEHLPDLIVTDLNMPDTNGYELIKSIKKNGYLSHIPVLLLTAMSSKKVQIEGLKIGADDVISKPIESHILIQKIRNRLDANKKLRDRWLMETSLVELDSVGPDLSPRTLSEIEESEFKKWVAKLNIYIEDNLMNKKNLTVHRIASHMGFNRERLFSSKMKALGLGTPTSYVRKYRLQLVYNKLKNGDKNKIAVLAMEHGFTPEGLSMEFKNEFGITPSKLSHQ